MVTGPGWFKSFLGEGGKSRHRKVANCTPGSQSGCLNRKVKCYALNQMRKRVVMTGAQRFKKKKLSIFSRSSSPTLMSEFLPFHLWRLRCTIDTVKGGITAREVKACPVSFNCDPDSAWNHLCLSIS